MHKDHCPMAADPRNETCACTDRSEPMTMNDKGLERLAGRPRRRAAKITSLTTQTREDAIYCMAGEHYLVARIYYLDRRYRVEPALERSTLGILTFADLSAAEFYALAVWLNWQSGAREPKPKKEKPKSRGQRLSEAASEGSDAIGRLIDIQQEFSEWKDGLPENLQSSSLGEKLEAICDLDIEGAQTTIEEACDAEIPLGFGRD